MRTLVVVNPRAREGRVGERWPQLEHELLGALGSGSTRVEMTSALDHGSAMVRKALREGTERVVVVGGDGTISEVLQGFFELGRSIAPEAVLAVMPAGRGDDFFKSLVGRRCKSSEEAWTQGLELLRSGQPRATDVGRITWLGADGAPLGVGGVDRMFINIASFGYPGLVVKRVSEHAGPLGRTSMGSSGWAYLTQIVTGLVQYRPITMEVRVDGEVAYEGPLFSGFALNGWYNAGGMRWADDAKLDDGVFSVVLSEPRNPFATAASGPRMLSGDWRGVRGVHVLSGKRIEVRTRESKERGFPLFEVDGDQPELAGTRGAVCEVMAGAVRVWR